MSRANIARFRMVESFPRQFGKYVLLKPLARGGMGEIYLAASGDIGGFEKLCVIKKVLTEKTDRAKANRFLDEAKVVLRLSHVNLVTTFDVGDVQGELYIAMELVDGKDLRDIWNRCVRTRTRIPLDVALFVAREIARSLAYVHSFGDLRLVHRDVAPPNILISYFGEVKLTDFGLARSVLKQEHTAPGVVFGRASYLAPEQARGEVADGRTDIYSLGIVLWELLTGQPYLQLAGLDPVTSLSLVRHPKPQPPSSRAPWIGAELDAVVMKALAPDRRARFQTADELRRALTDVMSRLAPRADAERAGDFLRGLYRDLLTDELAEREHLVKEALPAFRGQRLDEPHTPPTTVIPDRVPVGASAPLVAPAETPGIVREAQGNRDAARNRSAVPSGSVPRGREEDASNDRGGRSPAISVSHELGGESLHVAALRARSGSPPSTDAPVADLDPPTPVSADPPTTVWRRAGATQPPGTFVGRVIDNRYRIQRKIGEGGMGTVYAAEHVEIGKGVAVKILHPLYSGQQQLFERFRREARAASRVGHPHIVDVTDFGTTEDGCAYFVMEQLEGMDVADVLMHEGRLDVTRAVRITVQICRALEAAHAAGVIHRDLKPENIFLVARHGHADFVKVLDFGIARSASARSRRLTNPGMAMGTPEYMAPEQAQGHAADRRTDVYAVGALLYEMLIGTPPFRATSQEEMLERKHGVPESPGALRPEIPAALEAVILQALEPNPARRPQTMAQLEYELTKVIWGRPQAVAQLLGMRDVDPGWEAVPTGGPSREVTGAPELSAFAGMTAPSGESSDRRGSAAFAESQELAAAGGGRGGNLRSRGRSSVPAIAAFSGSGVVFDVPTNHASSAIVVDTASLNVAGRNRGSRTAKAAFAAAAVLACVVGGLLWSSRDGAAVFWGVQRPTLHQAEPPPMRGGPITRTVATVEAAVEAAVVVPVVSPRHPSAAAPTGTLPSAAPAAPPSGAVAPTDSASAGNPSPSPIASSPASPSPFPSPSATSAGAPTLSDRAPSVAVPLERRQARREEVRAPRRDAARAKAVHLAEPAPLAAPDDVLPLLHAGAAPPTRRARSKPALQVSGSDTQGQPSGAVDPGPPSKKTAAKNVAAPGEDLTPADATDGQ